MKIKKLKFEGHKVLGDLEIDFIDETGNPLDTVVFIGDNGTGKTKVLEAIVETVGYNKFKGSLESAQIEKTQEGIRLSKDSTNLIVEGMSMKNDIEYLGRNKFEQKLIIWMKADLSIELDRVTQESIELVELAEQWSLDDINEYIIDKINKEIYKDMSKPAKVAFDNESKEVNDIFAGLDMSVKMIGLSGESGLPIFKSKQEKIVELKDLSSGEKQLFFRMLNLKRLNVNDTIIIIDEPETSLHPEWQRKIIDVYKNIGENNQIIIATHSPLIIGSVPTESIRIMSRNDEGKIEVHQQDIYEKSHGKTADYILKVTMDLDTLRDEKTQKNIDLADELLQNNKYETAKYKKLMNSLIEQLGSDDQDVLRIQMAQAVRMRKNAESE